MAPAESKRRSRKRRRATAAPQAPDAPVRPRSAREAIAMSRRPQQQGAMSMMLTGRTYGEPPAGRFGGVPVSELAIVIGTAGIVVGVVTRAVPALVAGVIVVTLAVAEFSAREHFAGYRSHTALLAAIPAVATGALLAALIGSVNKAVVLVIVLLVFLVLFWLLRKRFRVARQARIAKAPAP